MGIIFDKNLEEKKSLIIVNNPSDAGRMKMARWGVKDADNIGIVHLYFYFDAYPYPAEYTDSAIKALDSHCTYSTLPWLTDTFREFLKLNLDDFERIAVWHGNQTSDLMFLYFFADYYGKPFHVMDISQCAQKMDVSAPSALSAFELSQFFGKERLLTMAEVEDLRSKLKCIRLNDTGYHSINTDGVVVNVYPEQYTDILYSVLKQNGGELKMGRYVGQIVSEEIRFNSIDFIEKVIIHHLKNGLLKAFWIDDNTPIPPDQCRFVIEQFPDSRDFTYGKVIVRLP